MSNSNIYHNDDNNNSSNTTANNSDVDPKIKEQCKQTITKSLKRTYQLFEPNRGALPNPDFASQRLRLSVKIQGEYKALAQPQAKQLIDSQQKQPLLIQNQQQRLALTYTAPDQRQDAVAAAAAGNVAGPHPYPNAPGVTLSPETQAPASDVTPSQIDKLIQSLPPEQRIQTGASVADITGSSVQVYKPPPTTAMILKQKAKEVIKPKWHAPWKLMRVISGHQGWVRTVAVDTSNEWFATGATDRTIKIWDLASGTLKLTLTGHISAVRAIVISDRHPYMFSVGEDKMIKCWDLEQNKVVRQYHGHLSGIYCAAMHPTLDLLVTGGRDSTARVWDIRTKTQVHVLSGHRDAVASVVCQSTDPQIITGSHDSTIRLWDVAAGKTMAVLTNHKKSVRALAIHPSEYTFVSASPDNIKKWKCPEGQFMMNFSGHNSMINSVAINNDNVLVSAGDNGSMYFWDWKSGYNFQQTETVAQPGSLDSEQGIFATCFDHSGSRLITGEADKTIKVWREDPNATEETHPINFNPDLKPKRY